MSDYDAQRESLIAPPPAVSSESPPTTLKERILDWDRKFSRTIYDKYHGKYEAVLLILEYSGHLGIWVIAPLLWFFFKPDLKPLIAASLLNYLVLSTIDLILIAVLKPLVGRRRPSYNSGLIRGTVEAIDQYSFPSGHATRVGLNASFIAYLQIWYPTELYKFMRSPVFLAIVTIWAIAVALSRVALGRHHFLDVSIGFLIGVLNVDVWHYFWISPSSAQYVRDSLRSLLRL